MSWIFLIEKLASTLHLHQKIQTWRFWHFFDIIFKGFQTPKICRNFRDRWFGVRRLWFVSDHLQYYKLKKNVLMRAYILTILNQKIANWWCSINWCLRLFVFLFFRFSEFYWEIFEFNSPTGFEFTSLQWRWKHWWWQASHQGGGQRMEHKRSFQGVLRLWRRKVRRSRLVPEYRLQRPEFRRFGICLLCFYWRRRSRKKSQLIIEISLNYFLMSQPTFLELYEELSSTRNLTLVICCAISVVCLLILLAAFVITQETKFIHGKIIMCHSISLLVALVGLIINYLSLITPGTTLCYLTGGKIHFSFAALIYNQIFLQATSHTLHLWVCFSGWTWCASICTARTGAPIFNVFILSHF